MFATEWCAVERTRRFFVDVYLRHNGQPNVPTHPDLWHLTAWGSVDELLQNIYNDRTNYPWIPYLVYFDEMKAQGFSAEASAEPYRFAGQLHLTRRDYVSATASFKRALEQRPQLAANRDFIAEEAQAASGLRSIAEETQAASGRRFQVACDKLLRELDRDAFSLLVKAIEEPDGELAGEASAALSDATYAAIPVLEEVAINGNVRARHQATILLERLEQSESAVPGLATALSSPEPKVRQVAACKLKQFGPKAKSAVPALIKALADEDEMLQWYVCDTLGAIGPDAKEAVPFLRDQLTAGKAGLRSAVASALMRIEPMPASQIQQPGR
jgi:HEAT repeat protein